MWWASWVTKRNINTTESSEAGKPYDTSLSHMDSQIYSYLLFKLVAKHGLVVISAAIQGIRRFITSWRVICCNARHSKSEHKTLFLNSIQFLLPIDLSNPLYLIRIVCLHQTHSVLEVHFLIFLVQHCIHYLNHFEVHLYVCVWVSAERPIKKEQKRKVVHIWVCSSFSYLFYLWKSFGSICTHESQLQCVCESYRVLEDKQILLHQLISVQERWKPLISKISRCTLTHNFHVYVFTISRWF